MHDTVPDEGLTAAQMLEQGFDTVNHLSHEVVEGLTGDELSERLDADANPIGWLVWHVARVQDQLLSPLGGFSELWHADGWDARFDLPGTDSTGEGHSREEVARVPVQDAALLLAYADAVHAQVVRVVQAFGAASPQPAASHVPEAGTGKLLTGILLAVTQHCGQAAYAKGILLRRRHPAK